MQEVRGFESHHLHPVPSSVTESRARCRGYGRRSVKPARLLERILRGDVGNIRFDDLVRLARALGFREIGGRGSHRVFSHPRVHELLNLQHEKGQAKRYQARQVAALVRKYDLTVEGKR